MPHDPASSDEHAGAIRAFLRDVDSLVRAGGDTSETVQAVKNRLAALIRECPPIPDPMRRTHEEHYARHLLYGDPEGRFEVIVMAWGPGQQTPIHDHAGIWCVEGVLQGVIDVTRYDIEQVTDGRMARLRRGEVIRAGLGQCGALIPPVEHHRIANPYADPAVSMHVYGGRMHNCRIFLERPDSAYDIALKPLSYTTREHALSSL